MKILHSLLLLSGFAVTARADLVAVYEMTNNSTIPAIFAPGVSGSAFTTGPSLANGIANNNLFSTSVTNGTNSALLAVTNGQYFQFTITPPVDGKLNLERFAFEASKEAPNSVGRGWVLRSSADNFAANLGTQDIVGPAPTWTDFSVALTGPQFTNLVTPITFRIYTYATAQLEFVDYDNIQLFGKVNDAPTVAVTDINPTPRRLIVKGTATDDSDVSRVTVNGKAAGAENWSSSIVLRRQRVVTLFIQATDDGGANSVTFLRVRRPRT